MEITKKEMKVLLKSQQGELDAVLMYNALAKVVKNTSDAQTFLQLAKEEGHHASVFHKLTNRVIRPKKQRQFFFLFYIKFSEVIFCTLKLHRVSMLQKKTMLR